MRHRKKPSSPPARVPGAAPAGAGGSDSGGPAQGARGKKRARGRSRPAEHGDARALLAALSAAATENATAPPVQRPGLSAPLGPRLSAPAPRPAAKGGGDAGTAAEAGTRTNSLVATNAVHATARRGRRRLHQGRAIAIAAATAIFGILILTGEIWRPDTPVPEATGLHGLREVAERGARPAAPDAAPTPAADITVEALSLHQLTELELLLARLQLEPSRPDGVVDLQTKSAIRLYQQIAGLPIDGRPSPALLEDVREVVRILDGPEQPAPPMP